MTQRSIAVISAGLSQPSSTRLLADQLADATVRAVGPAGARLVVIELRELAHDIVNNLLTGFASPALQHAIDEIAASDGLIAVTPLYSGSYNGLFKSFFDVLEPDLLVGKPVLIGATGGTARHSLALEYAIRPLFSYLHAVALPTAVFAATSDFGGSATKDFGGAEAESLTQRIARAGIELATAIEQRPPLIKADPYESALSFEQLLARRA